VTADVMAATQCPQLMPRTSMTMLMVPVYTRRGYG
jgi:hypothetical protein